MEPKSLSPKKITKQSRTKFTFKAQTENENAHRSTLFFVFFSQGRSQSVYLLSTKQRMRFDKQEPIVRSDGSWRTLKLHCCYSDIFNATAFLSILRHVFIILRVQHIRSPGSNGRSVGSKIWQTKGKKCIFHHSKKHHSSSILDLWSYPTCFSPKLNETFHRSFQHTRSC